MRSEKGSLASEASPFFSSTSSRWISKVCAPTLSLSRVPNELPAEIAIQRSFHQRADLYDNRKCPCDAPPHLLNLSPNNAISQQQRERLDRMCFRKGETTRGVKRGTKTNREFSIPQSREFHPIDS